MQTGWVNEHWSSVLPMIVNQLHAKLQQLLAQQPLRKESSPMFLPLTPKGPPTAPQSEYANESTRKTKVPPQLTS